MTGPAYCIHDLPAGSCTICLPPESRPAFIQPADLGPWFTASYDSDCDGCGNPVCEGDQIRSDGEGGWLCCDCGEPTP